MEQLGDWLCIGSGLLLLAGALFAYRQTKKRLRRIERKMIKILEVRAEQKTGYRQIEALIALNTAIRPRIPLPPMRGWAASPDLLNVIVNQIAREKSRVIVECGSGVSTCVVAYALQKSGTGRLFSLEHSIAFADETRTVLRMHELQEWASVLVAELSQTEIRGENYQWYATHELFQLLDEFGTIDLLIVDGPPGELAPMARYPAIPMLFERLSDNATVLIDDFNRTDEAAIVNKWISEYPLVIETKKATEKGVCILRRMNAL